MADSAISPVHKPFSPNYRRASLPAALSDSPSVILEINGRYRTLSHQKAGNSRASGQYVSSHRRRDRQHRPKAHRTAPQAWSSSPWACEEQGQNDSQQPPAFVKLSRSRGMARCSSDQESAQGRRCCCLCIWACAGACAGGSIAVGAVDGRAGYLCEA